MKSKVLLATVVALVCAVLIGMLFYGWVMLQTTNVQPAHEPAGLQIETSDAPEWSTATPVPMTTPAPEVPAIHDDSNVGGFSPVYSYTVTFGDGTTAVYWQDMNADDDVGGGTP